jgi:hypothetical protein
MDEPPEAGHEGLFIGCESSKYQNSGGKTIARPTVKGRAFAAEVDGMEAIAPQVAHIGLAEEPGLSNGRLENIDQVKIEPR